MPAPLASVLDVLPVVTYVPSFTLLSMVQQEGPRSFNIWVKDQGCKISNVSEQVLKAGMEPVCVPGAVAGA